MSRFPTECVFCLDEGVIIDENGEETKCPHHEPDDTSGASYLEGTEDSGRER